MNAVAVPAPNGKTRSKYHPAVLFDAIVNALSGSGGATDPGSQNYAAHVEITYEQALVLYRHYWLARKVIDIPVADMMKNGRRFHNMTPADEKRYRERWTELHADMRMSTALKWGRLVGGGVIIAVNENMDMAEPLNIADIANGKLERLLVFDAKAFPSTQGTKLESNLAKRNYGMPTKFQHKGLPLDPSHMIVAHGMEQPNPDIFHINMGVHPWFGASMMQYCKEPIIQAHAAYEAVASMVQSNNMDVLKVPGLYDMITACATDAERAELNGTILNRMALMQAHKSMHNAAVIDSTEELDRMKYDLTSMPAIIREALVAVSGSGDIPMTRFSGISPGGMNATGEGDMQNYQDGLVSQQAEKVRPLYDGVDYVVTADVFGEPRQLEYTINSPNSETDLEVLEREAKQAELLSTLDDIQSIPDSVVLTRIKDTILPDIPQSAIDALRAEESDNDENDDIKE